MVRKENRNEKRCYIWIVGVVLMIYELEHSWSRHFLRAVISFFTFLVKKKTCMQKQLRTREYSLPGCSVHVIFFITGCGCYFCLRVIRMFVYQK